MHPLEPSEIETLSAQKCSDCKQEVGWSKTMLGDPICEACSVEEVQRLRRLLRKIRVFTEQI